MNREGEHALTKALPRHSWDTAHRGEIGFRSNHGSLTRIYLTDASFAGGFRPPAASAAGTMQNSLSAEVSAQMGHR